MVVPPWKLPFFLLFTLGIYHVFWLYRVFKELYERKATDTSPNRAVGLLFVPIFGWVWLFIVSRRLGAGISNAYTYAKLQKPDTTAVWCLPIGLFAACAVFLLIPLLAGLVHLVFLSIALCTTQDQMNHLARETGTDAY